MKRARPVHRDHPLRHFDRTCPGCYAEARGGVRFLRWLLNGVYAAAGAGLVLAMLLTGCASPGATVNVSKAVAQACPTTVPPRPAYPVDRLTGDEDEWAIGTALWAERKLRQAHEIDLTNRLRGCVEPAQ